MRSRRYSVNISVLHLTGTVRNTELFFQYAITYHLGSGVTESLFWGAKAGAKPSTLGGGGGGVKRTAYH